MAELTTQEGVQFYFDASAITAVADRDVDTGEAATTVYGVIDRPLRLAESVPAFLGRLQVANSFATLTRLDNSPIWINCTAVHVIRPAFPGEYHSGASAVVSIDGLRIAVKESPRQARQVINAHGGKL